MYYWPVANLQPVVLTLLLFWPNIIVIVCVASDDSSVCIEPVLLLTDERIDWHWLWQWRLADDVMTYCWCVWPSCAVIIIVANPTVIIVCVCVFIVLLLVLLTLLCVCDCVAAILYCATAYPATCHCQCIGDDHPIITQLCYYYYYAHCWHCVCQWQYLCVVTYYYWYLLWWCHDIDSIVTFIVVLAVWIVLLLLLWPLLCSEIDVMIDPTVFLVLW